MAEHDDKVMIALLPTTTFWCRIDLPHLTLVYAGDVTNLTQDDKSSMAKTVADIAKSFNPVPAVVLGTNVFGEGEEMVEVLELKLNEQLDVMRSMVQHWNASQYTEFKPHVTVGDLKFHGSLVPNIITFDRIGLFWGSDSPILQSFAPLQFLESDEVLDA